jgi:hypothetical protein
MVEATGNTTGTIKGSKVGDAVVRFTEESAFFGSAMVVEAKRNRTHQVGDALSELDTTMRNRGATTGRGPLRAQARRDPDTLSARQRDSRLRIPWRPPRGVRPVENAKNEWLARMLERHLETSSSFSLKASRPAKSSASDSETQPPGASSAA